MKNSMKTIMLTLAAATMMIGTAYAQTPATPATPAKAAEAAPASKAAMSKPAVAATQAATEKASAPASAAASSVKTPRDAATGQSSGKRQHQPVKAVESAPASTPESAKPPVKK